MNINISINTNIRIIMIDISKQSVAVKTKKHAKNNKGTRSSWLNFALRDDEAVCSIGHYEAVAVGN